MPNLQRVNITFNTHNDDRDHDTILHVFVKNRSNTSSTPEGATTFIANLLAFQESASLGPNEINPYLAFAQIYGPLVESVRKTGKVLLACDAVERGCVMQTVAANLT